MEDQTSSNSQARWIKNRHKIIFFLAPPVVF